MFLETMLKPVAYLYDAHVRRIEKRLGYRVTLHQDPNQWIDGAMAFDMTSVWRRFGIAATGVNYFTLGRVVDGLSSRFDPGSPQYQAWLGGYIVRFSDTRNWTVDDHFRLGEADQKNWLSLYGVGHPTVAIDFAGIRDVGEIEIGTYRGRLYYGGGRSNTDVGNHMHRVFLSLLWGCGVSIFKKDRPQLLLRSSAFIPPVGESTEEPYHVIRLDGYVVIVEIDPHTRAVLYVNGCSFEDKDGQNIDTFTNRQDALKQALRNVRIVRL